MNLSIKDLPRDLAGYERLSDSMSKLPTKDYVHVVRALASGDLFFLVTRVLTTAQWKHPDGEPLFYRQWFLDRCREIQFDSDDNVLDVWARFHAKTTIKTFANLIRLILQDQNITIGLFSAKGLDAQKMMGEIKLELEENRLLKRLFPDILWADPQRQSGKWSGADGITVRRTIHYKNATIEPVGLIDGAATGGRYKHRHYDDVINEKHCSADMCEKAFTRWAQTQYQRVPGGTQSACGTFYFRGDVYQRMVQNGVRLRMHPCYEVNLEESKFDSYGLPMRLVLNRDKPVVYSVEELEELRSLTIPEEGGEDTFPVQMECDINAASQRRFKVEWLQFYSKPPLQERRASPGNVVILVDPANSKKKDACFTAMWVVKLGSDRKFYVLDAVREQMSLTERADKLFYLHRKWSPIWQTRYEKIGMQGDVEYIQERQDRESYRFPIMEVGRSGRGTMPKDDRIERLVPMFQSGDIYFPDYIPQEMPDGTKANLVEIFQREEYLAWPSSKYKDQLDALARLIDEDCTNVFPNSADTAQDRWTQFIYGKGQQQGDTALDWRTA